MTGWAWHEADSAEFARTRPILESEFPYLHVVERDGDTVVAGDFPLVLGGQVVTSYEIEVVIPRCGPLLAVPIVRETGSRIPRNADHHINYDGTACLFVEAEYWYKHPKGLNLVDFLRGPVETYFVAQFAYEQSNEWPFGQRSHGTRGIVEFYASVLGTWNRRTICRFLEVITAKKTRGFWPCPCGSGSKIAACHAVLIQRLRDRIKRSAALTTLRLLKQEYDTPNKHAS